MAIVRKILDTTTFRRLRPSSGTLGTVSPSSAFETACWEDPAVLRHQASFILLEVKRMDRSPTEFGPGAAVILRQEPGREAPLSRELSACEAQNLVE